MGKEKTQGYPLEIFSGAVPVKYICEECKGILREPVQGPCGHRFCRKCVERICEDSVTRERLCPACVHSEEEAPETLSIKVISPDHAVRRELEKIQVHCTNQNCDWTGTLKHYESHEIACPHRTVVCRCGEVVLVDRLGAHRASSCPASESPSPMNSFAKMSIGGVDDLRSKVEFLEAQLALGGLNSRDEALDHIRRLEEKVVALEAMYKSASMRGGSSALSSSYATLSDLDQYKQIIKKISQKVSTFESLSVVLNNQIQQVVSQLQGIDESLKQVEEKQHRSDSRVKNFEKILALHDVRLGELEERISNVDQFTSYNGVFYWRIDNWKRKMEDAKDRRTTSIYSPSFYTGRFGYKMCMRLYPRGDGMGKDSHVSLFFVVMRGPYDALLPWPFVRKVTLTLLDQTTSAGDASDSFTPDPNSSSFQRPTAEMNVASGCPRFYEIDRLEHNSDRFLVNDTMFIKIVVDTSDIPNR